MYVPILPWCKDGTSGMFQHQAIALRLEPLKPGFPEYEKVLGEQKLGPQWGQMLGASGCRGSRDAKSCCSLWWFFPQLDF